MGIGEDILKQINIGDVICEETGETFSQSLIHAANRLKDCINNEIDKFYSSYSPKVYKRSYGLGNVMSVDDIADFGIDQSSLSIVISINDYMKPSLWGGESASVFWLMNSGYQVKNGGHKNVPYFGYRSGFNYIDRGIAKFEASDPLGIQITVERPYGN